LDVRVQRIPVSESEALWVEADLADGFLEVMGRDISHLAQIGVGAGEVCHVLGQRFFGLFAGGMSTRTATLPRTCPWASKRGLAAP